MSLCEKAGKLKPRPKWYEIAKKELGTKEVSGPKHNPRIIDYHAATSLKATEDEVAWCASFVGWCLEEAGIEGTYSALARSYMDWGEKLSHPKKGCIVIFRRGKPWQGHVGFLVRETAHSIYLLGGNQDDAVTIQAFSKEDVIGYRWPVEV